MLSWSWHQRMPPQCAALPLVVKCLSECRAVTPGRTSQDSRGERGPLSKPGERRHQPRKGVSYVGDGKDAQRAVFVVDQHHQPLMPCSEKRARLLLARRRAVVHRRVPFVIRLKDRELEQSQVQPVALKLDPGSQTTGMALARVQETPEGEVHHALHLAELAHRAEEIRQRLRKRAVYRRRRRPANLRYRATRFLNRRRPPGGLAPSVRSRIGNVLTWATRYQRWAPLVRLDVERVKFDTQWLQDPEITGVQYQRGELAGWEVRLYVLEKFGRQCAYCGRTQTAFELDHIWPRSRGGSDRVSNLALSCHECNTTKGSQTASEFGHPQVEARARQPLKDAAAMNASRYALCEALGRLGLPMGTWSGGRTRWNRDRFGVGKTHAHDMLSVGDLAGVGRGDALTLRTEATAREHHCRTYGGNSGLP